MTITPEALVAREVHYCVSYLVSALAGGYGLAQFDEGDLGQAAEQAMELASPIDDWEEAAIEHGWSETETPGAFVNTDGSAFAVGQFVDAKWQVLCEECAIEPYQRDVYEHWIVSDWLADRLAEKGEKVDKDFAGMTVWARTTTGQGIASDGVIETICAELNGEA